MTDIRWPVIPRRWTSPASPDTIPSELDPVAEFFSAAPDGDEGRDDLPRSGTWARLTGAVGSVAAGAVTVALAIIAPVGVIGLVVWIMIQNVDPTGDLVGRLLP